MNFRSNNDMFLNPISLFDMGLNLDDIDAIRMQRIDKLEDERGPIETWSENEGDEIHSDIHF